MLDWVDTLSQVEALEDVALDAGLVARMQSNDPRHHGRCVGSISFYTPTFKSYASNELASCGKHMWPAVSITGGDCRQQCDHCNARLLETMIAARTPQDLWSVVNERIAAGAQGMLLSGGSNSRGEVEYDAFYPTIGRIKAAFPEFKIAIHAALVDRNAARRMEDSGLDVAMLDVIGAQDTVRQVYHLKRSVAEFESSLQCLTETSLRVVPHIVIGLHYGRLLGEWEALAMVRRHPPAALALVVIMPHYAPALRPFVVPDSHDIGRFFIDARAALPEIPVVLGCARPPGLAKQQIDAYAVLAGLNGIAHPADGMVELAARLGRDVRVSPACCAMGVGDALLASDSVHSDLPVDIQRIIAAERGQRSASQLRGIRVVGARSGCL